MKVKKPFLEKAKKVGLYLTGLQKETTKKV